jgi:hypothetical protein
MPFDVVFGLRQVDGSTRTRASYAMEWRSRVVAFAEPLLQQATARALREASTGLGLTVASPCCPSTSYQARSDNRCLFF